MITLLSYAFYFVAASISPLWRRWLAKTKNADNKGQIHFAFQTMFVVSILSLSLPFFSPFYIVGNQFTIIFLALIVGIFLSGFYISSYISQKYVEAGVSSVIANIYTPITIVLSTFLLHEGLTFLQIVGTVLLLVAIIIVSKKHRIGRFHFDKYFLLMLLSGIMLSVCLVSERALMKITGFSAGVMLSWWSCCVFLGIITFITRNKSEYSKKDILLTGGFRFFQDLSLFFLTVVLGNF